MQHREKRIDKSCVVTGTRVVAKSSAARNAFERTRFAHEVAVYRAFGEHRPPVMAPELVLAGADRLLVTTRLPGTPMGTGRTAEPAPDTTTFKSVVATLSELHSWRPPAEAFTSVLDYPSTIGRNHDLGFFTHSDVEALHACLGADDSIAEFNHGSPNADNILLDDHGGVGLVGWSRAGWYQPGYDLATLLVLYADVPHARSTIAKTVFGRDIEAPFTVNLSLVLAGELTAEHPPTSDTQRHQRVGVLEQLWERTRQRLHQLSGTDSIIVG